MIVFGWRGFPQYAARCVGAFVKTSKEPVVVVGPKPMVPVEGMERVCGCPVYWTDRVHDFSSQVSAFKPEDVSTLIVSGWGIPALDDLREKVRKAGGRIVMTSDHRYTRGLRAFLKNIRFRLLFRSKFDRFFVPGKSGRKLMRSWGIPDHLIVEGLYSADASLFTHGKPLSEREKKIIYVGQFSERKNVRLLVQTFCRLRDEVEVCSGWSLELYGSGPLKDELNQIIKQSNNPTIHIHDFVQPEQLAALYQTARLFCLPSFDENWGLVVHEAALSGCPLLLSNQIGAADDLLVEGKNGWMFDPSSVDDMSRVMKLAMETDVATLTAMQQESIRQAKNASLEMFVEGIRRLVG